MKACLSGDLTIKDAYLHIHHSKPQVSWGKIIWSKVIPSSKTFILRRLLHNNLPTDELLRKCRVNVGVGMDWIFQIPI